MCRPNGNPYSNVPNDDNPNNNNNNNNNHGSNVVSRCC